MWSRVYLLFFSLYIIFLLSSGSKVQFRPQFCTNTSPQHVSSFFKLVQYQHRATSSPAWFFPMHATATPFLILFGQLTSQAIVGHNWATKKKTINLKGYIVGNALTDDYHDQLGLIQLMWSIGLISDETYKLLNVLCDFESFIHSSSSCNKIRGGCK